jgi:hypothetical protein
MVMRDILGAGNPARAAVNCRDPAIQALPEVGDDEALGTVAAERRIELDQSAPCGVQSAGVGRRSDRSRAGQKDRFGSRALLEQPLPCSLLIHEIFSPTFARGTMPLARRGEAP